MYGSIYHKLPPWWKVYREWGLVVIRWGHIRLKNHQSHPTGSVSLPKVNVVSIVNHRHGHWRGNYYGRGRGHGGYNSWNRDSHDPSQNKKNYPNSQRLDN